MELQMVDLRGQYARLRDELDGAVSSVLSSAAFIKGPEVKAFESELGTYLGVDHVISVGNGTDALQIAFMALGLGPGDEIIAPSFTFVATAEAAAALGIEPVFVDIDPLTFNLSAQKIEDQITERTRAIVPVHLYGQACEMDAIMDVARRHDLLVVEDAAQAVGAQFADAYAGAIGNIGTLSFFPSKNLGCFGDGGAVLTNDPDLAHQARMIANHGGTRKYFNERVGMNSRLDALQAAVLRVKLRHLSSFNEARISAADRYDQLFQGIPGIETPHRDPSRGRHVFHQYTIRIGQQYAGLRDKLSDYLRRSEVPHAVYYPIPVHRLPVYDLKTVKARNGDMTETDRAAAEVISLPMHTELTSDQQHYIVDQVLEGLRWTLTQ